MIQKKDNKPQVKTDKDLSVVLGITYFVKYLYYFDLNLIIMISTLSRKYQ